MVRNLKLHQEQGKDVPPTTDFLHCTGNPRECNKTREGNKMYASWAEKRIKTVLFTDDIITYIENPRKQTKKQKQKQKTKNPPPETNRKIIPRLQETRLMYESQVFSYMPAMNK